jgi:type I restriction enzyme, S subunit
LSRLPQGWTVARLGDLIDGIESGKNVKCIERPPADGERGIVKISAVTWGTFQENESKTVPPVVEVDERAQINTGDLLISRANTFELVGAAVRVRQISRKLYLSDKVLRLKAEEIILPWLHRALTSPAIRKAISDSSSGNQLSMRNISQEALKSLSIPVAPLPEQKRILARLEKALSKTEACRRRLERVPQILRRFREAVLEAAVSGKLTEEWRAANPGLDAREDVELLRRAHTDVGGHKRGNAADPTNEVHNLAVEDFPSGWGLLDLRDVVRPDRPITYGILKPGPDVAGGVLYIRVADYPNDCLNIESIRRTSSKIDSEFRRSRLSFGDVLLSIRGTVGRLVVIPAVLDGANITQDSARISVQSGIERDFILWYLRSPAMQSRMRKAAKGVAVRGINIGDVRALQIGIPPRREQVEIVRRVEELLTFADTLKQRYKTAAERVARLTPSLLEKGFRGELVSQDPTDEPASVLVERIRKVREEADAIPMPVKRAATEVIAARGLNPRAKRSIKRKTQRVAARSGSPMSKRLSSMKAKA